MITRRDIDSSPFGKLQEQALALIQELSGNTWTNFNEHDPGVTILDTLHYALLELQYSLGHPFESYLSEGREVDFGRMGLLDPQALFIPDMLRVSDYERFLLEHLKTISACRVTLLENHRYRIEVESPLAEEGSTADLRTLTGQVEELYHSHRNLCENLEEIRVVKAVSGHHPAFRFKEELQWDPPSGVRHPGILRFSAAHYPLRNHFPDCYGINDKGLSAGADPQTQAKVRQLSAYLLIFDYLLANARRQVAALAQLVELSGSLPAQRMPSLLQDDGYELIDPARLEANTVVDVEYLHLQKSRYLDQLDVLYGENTKRFFPQEKSLGEQNRRRADLIRYLPHLNRIRFRSFNLLKINEKSSDSAGVIQFLATINGARRERETSLTNLFSRYHLRLLGDEEFFRNYPNLDMKFVSHYIEHQLFDYEIEPVPTSAVSYQDGRYAELRSSIYLLWHNVLFESFLTEGIHPENYRMAYWYKTNGYLLIFHLPGKQEWLNLGLFADKQKLVETANLLWQFLAVLRAESQQIYLVEHILLEQPECNANRLTVVVPHWIQMPFSLHQMKDLLTERLPAHLDIHFSWLHAQETHAFEKCYFEWREALAGRDKNWIRESSAALLERIGAK